MNIKKNISLIYDQKNSERESSEKKKKKNFRKWNIPKLRLDCPENRESLQLDVFSWVPCTIIAYEI